VVRCAWRAAQKPAELAAFNQDNIDPQAGASRNDPDTGSRNANREDKQNNQAPRPLALDLAEEITGMYRLLDLISESGSNGCGKELLVAPERRRANPAYRS
jgi:hypothetical protein